MITLLNLFLARLAATVYDRAACRPDAFVRLSPIWAYPTVEHRAG